MDPTAILGNDVTQGGLYVGAILTGTQWLKDNVIPKAWLAQGKRYMPLVTIAVGIAIHWLAGDAATFQETAVAGIRDAVYAIGVFRGGKHLVGSPDTK